MFYYKLDINNLDKRFNKFTKETIGVIDYDLYLMTEQKADFAKDIKEQDLPQKIKNNLKLLNEAKQQDEQKRIFNDILFYKSQLIESIQNALVLGNNASLDELRKELRETENQLTTYFADYLKDDNKKDE